MTTPLTPALLVASCCFGRVSAEQHSLADGRLDPSLSKKITLWVRGKPCPLSLLATREVPLQHLIYNLIHKILRFRADSLVNNHLHLSSGAVIRPLLPKLPIQLKGGYLTIGRRKIVLEMFDGEFVPLEASRFHAFGKLSPTLRGRTLTLTDSMQRRKLSISLDPILLKKEKLFRHPKACHFASLPQEGQYLKLKVL